jgi:type I restriction enzyme, S subunit
MPDHSLLLESPPHGWMPVNFSDACTRVQETAAPSAYGERYYLGLEHIASGFPGLVGRGKESDVRSGKTAFCKSDVLFGKLRPYLRKSVLVHENGICSTDILVFRATEICIPELLCFLTHTDEFVGHAKATTSGVQHPRTSWAALREFKLHIPPLHEQRKIAAVLGLVQRAIEEQESLLALTTELKKTLLHKLFTEGLRGETQKQTEIGPVPESWDIIDLIKVVEQIDYGISAPIPKTPPENGVKIVSTADITKDGRLLYEKIRRITASEKTVKRLTLQTGDVLFNWRNSAELIGKSAVFQEQSEPHVFASFILRIKCDEKKSHNFFLANLMNHFREKCVFLKLARRAVNQANYNRNEISVLKIPLPTYEEQRDIANSISAIDAKIHHHRHKREKLESLFHNLLHQLMTAQIRVHDLDRSKEEADETE